MSQILRFFERWVFFKTRFKERKSFSDQTVSIKFSWRVSRVNNNPETVGVVMGERQIFLQPFVNGERNPKRIELSNMLKTSNSSQTPVVIENILPKFLKITNKGNADPISKLMAGDRDNGSFCPFFRRLFLPDGFFLFVRQFFIFIFLLFFQLLLETYRSV